MARALLHGLASAPVLVEIARQEWEESHRRLEGERSDRGRYATLLAQTDVVNAELRRRVGSTFTLDELVRAYDDAERWGREAVAERAHGTGWPRDLTLVLGAAFHRYQTGALDYEP